MSLFTRFASVVLVLVVCGCETSRQEVPPNGMGTGGTNVTGGPSSTGGASADGGTSGSVGGTTGNVGGTGGGMGGATPIQCLTVDGELAYGPIGEPALVSDPMPSQSCSARPGVTPPAVLGDCPFWTGQRYLKVISDDRGMVATTFDDAGVIVGEEIVFSEPGKAILSRKDDAVLVVLYGAPDLPSPALYALLDAQGTLLGPTEQLAATEEGWTVWAAIVATQDGWLTALGYEGSPGGLLLFDIGKDGRLRREKFVPQGGHLYLLGGLVPSAVGGYLLAAQYDTGGVFSGSFNLVYLIDDALEVVYFEDGQQTGTGQDAADGVGFLGIVDDAERDLIYGQPEGWMAGDPYVVQEYGCLD